ncbi:2-succinyl-6-hydroxy-2,4-cyclohexadiene-1-carboxylate synthase [Bacillus sp. DNRA2]|uniref:2-succinyl-6-hydroxy-2, 4-cyclohexadiene-1-carboxylate synthase n=1 Tax=Bacillus sp. DNRA2 TaxID=2723053 RepID=UPI002006DCFA|nr:2-succinyl-6-hydroxy-2,4-cyclohexadiene-1-carboxylate synthase [Bacillus sp. DNRA2]
MATGQSVMNLEVNGLRYHVETVGEGYPLVVLHGFTGSGENWRSLSGQWSEHSKVIMIDIIGHGETESPVDFSRYGMDFAVHDLAALLEKLGFDQVDFLGYSMGGRLALSFAVTHPERVRKLVLESASPGLKTEAERALRRENDAKLAEMIRTEGIESFVNYWERIPLFASQLLIPREVREQTRKQRLANSVAGLSGSLLGMGTGAQSSCWEALGQLSCEVLLITGELDKKFCQIASEMVDLVKNSKWVVVDQCGHAIHVEQPEKFGTIVSGFLKLHNKEEM